MLTLDYIGGLPQPRASTIANLFLKIELRKHVCSYINFIILNVGNVQMFTRILNDELYRLDVSERILFKLCIRLYKCLHIIAPKTMNLYRSVSVIEGQSLRSTVRGRNVRRAFSFARRSAWNSLPNYLKDSSLTLVLCK